MANEKWSEQDVGNLNNETHICVINNINSSPKNELVNAIRISETYIQDTRPSNVKDNSIWISLGTGNKYVIINNVAVEF